ncbi:metallophosphoesterase [Arenibaculum pallidiluteum]|uniref:metallophosphoesterase n=1 Tax=Arenibaculum pallidiluteum TaxID=2812559 RepID=UPI001A95E8DE|nr:metallophosphoesterase [Arenibaculum pallidiluteum]
MAEPAGILFIGDPHLSSRRPGRRRDHDFAATCLDRLDQCIALAGAEDLLPVILGDLFDRPREDDHGLIVRAIRILRTARHMPFCLVGNHDRVDARLGDDTALALVREAGAVRTIETPGPVFTRPIGGRRVGLGATPHGDAIPRDVTGLFPDAETVAWLTHHDLAIGRTYPGAEPVFPIIGCDVVVNGHMHGLEPPRRTGGTLWFNPGNILRQSVDMIDHVPAAWAWDPKEPHSFGQRPLRYDRDVFDLTGRHAAPIAPGAEARPSVFAELLGSESRSEMERTSDGSVLLEEIERLFAEDDVPPEVRAVVLALHRDTVGDAA